MAAVTEASTEVQAEAEKGHEERFPWRGWVHVPEPEASACDHATDGQCKDEDHFHALIRLPNPYQQSDIVEKGQAARARRLRMLRDEDSDARVILEDELDGLKTVPPEIIVDELVDRTFAEDYMVAVREVENRLDESYEPKDEEDIPKLYANIDQDREEYLRQRGLPEEQRGDDYAELEKAYANYSRDVQAELERIVAPKKEHLMSLDIGELIGMVRQARCEQQGTEAYLKAYQQWQMYTGTFKPKLRGTPIDRVWPDINFMRHVERSDVILAVKSAFDDLEGQLARTRSGKGS